MHTLLVPIRERTVPGSRDRRRRHGPQFTRQLTRRFTFQFPQSKEKLTLLVPVAIRDELPSLRNLSQFGCRSAHSEGYGPIVMQ
jgi:hypothetical protein